LEQLYVDKYKNDITQSLERTSTGT